MSSFITLPDNYTAVQKFGRIPDMDAADTNEDIWDGTGVFPFLDTAVTMTISSDSANDTAVGSGARRVRVMGLDEYYNEVAIDVTLNGTTGVTLPTKMLIVYRMYILSVGSGGTNAGSIWVGTGDITAGVPAVKHAGISALQGQTLMAVYQVPERTAAGKNVTSAKILSWYATVGAVQAAFATVALQTREYGAGWRSRRVKGIGEAGDMEDDMAWGFTLKPRAQIRVRAFTCGANNSALTAGFDLIMNHE